MKSSSMAFGSNTGKVGLESFLPGLKPNLVVRAYPTSSEAGEAQLRLQQCSKSTCMMGFIAVCDASVEDNLPEMNLEKIEAYDLKIIEKVLNELEAKFRATLPTLEPTGKGSSSQPGPMANSQSATGDLCWLSMIIMEPKSSWN
ncbi:hypothetical protein ACH5RR_026526 [Cinchona calisaya]|uniref:Uncharacterized protein n=1 Tax=Cinchona calisaya TaxID=153742 RepID=A0ABD2Z2U4_9GENT